MIRAEQRGGDAPWTVGSQAGVGAVLGGAVTGRDRPVDGPAAGCDLLDDLQGRWDPSRPAPRVRSPLQLSLADREEISRGLAAGISCRAIATSLGRAPSPVTREINRNGGPGGYRALAADGAAWKASTRPKVSKLVASPKLAEMVTEGLKQRWSPQQIAGWLRRIHPDEPSAVGVARDFSTGRCSCRPKVP
jgi:hypothetical protein